ncbi:MAG TPA: hypothetical protein VG321_11975, partial [Solirubrobacteraceae bacterium]|nr:hypothetical protein [Solirubrobacteraceae bacterium]
MRLAPEEANVQLREDAEGNRAVVLAFPYDGQLVAAVRTLPGRSFDWDRREWSAPADDWVAMKLRQILEHYPELTTSSEVDEWLKGAVNRWVGYVRTTRYAGRGWWSLHTLFGKPPEGLLATGAVQDEERTLVPLSKPAAAQLEELTSARFSPGAVRCLELVDRGEQPPPARLILARGVAGTRFSLEVLWDPEVAVAFEQLPGASRNELKLDPWIADQLDAFVSRHEVQVAPAAAEALSGLVAQHRESLRAVAASRATRAEPIEKVQEALGGQLAPFQWAAVRYALKARRCFLADEQGLGKTVEALATLEADGAFPAVVV